MTREEEKQIIRQNQDKPLNEIKRILKNKMTMEQRTEFTTDHFFQLIIEVHQEDSNKNKNINNTRKVKGEER